MEAVVDYASLAKSAKIKKYLAFCGLTMGIGWTDCAYIISQGRTPSLNGRRSRLITEFYLEISKLISWFVNEVFNIHLQPYKVGYGISCSLIAVSTWFIISNWLSQTRFNRLAKESAGAPKDAAIDLLTNHPT